jgi:hypothetical protein
LRKPLPTWLSCIVYEAARTLPEKRIRGAALLKKQIMVFSSQKKFSEGPRLGTLSLIEVCCAGCTDHMLRDHDDCSNNSKVELVVCGKS